MAEEDSLVALVSKMGARVHHIRDRPINSSGGFCERQHNDTDRYKHRTRKHWLYTALKVELK